MPHGKGTYGSQVGRPSKKKRKQYLKGGGSAPAPSTSNQVMRGIEREATSRLNPFYAPANTALQIAEQAQIGDKVIDPRVISLLDKTNNTVNNVVKGVVEAVVPGGKRPLRDWIKRRRAAAAERKREEEEEQQPEREESYSGGKIRKLYQEGGTGEERRGSLGPLDHVSLLGQEKRIVDQRIDATIADEIDFITRYGRDYWQSGTKESSPLGLGLLSGASQALGASGRGERAWNNLKDINLKMKGGYSEEELWNKFNDQLISIFPDNDDYRLSVDFLDREENYSGGRVVKAHGGEMEDQMNALAISVAPAKVEEQETHTMPDGTVMPGATHEEYEEQQLPDEEMEADYVDFVVSSTLNEQDHNYLESALAEDAKLSEIFDQVVESASEFSGSGPIEGPGTEVSDSIPARLSDGEFVFTAKATEELGEDNLMSIMKDAEAAADERQGVAYGGVIDEEEDRVVPIQTRGSVAAQGNVPNVVKQSRQVEEEMLKSSPRRYYVPVSG